MSVGLRLSTIHYTSHITDSGGTGAAAVIVCGSGNDVADG